MYKRQANSLALSIRLLGGNERGVGVEEASRFNDDLDKLLYDIKTESSDLRVGSFTPMSVRISGELATEFAVSYAQIFGKIPSLRHDSIYKQFVDEITGNDLPINFRLSIGKNQLGLANQRAQFRISN